MTTYLGSKEMEDKEANGKCAICNSATKTGILCDFCREVMFTEIDK